MCPLQRTSGPYSGVSLLMPIGEVANSAREMATTRNFTGVFISVVAYLLRGISMSTYPHSF